MKRAIDFIKTAAIYILTASMLTFTGLYINEKQNAGKEEGIPADKMRILESMMGTAPLTGADKNHIKPLQITVTADGRSYTAVYNENAVSDIYEHFIRGITGIFGSGSKCVRLDKEEGDKLWRECTEKENSAYIRYAGNYLYPVIYAFWENIWDAEMFPGELAMVNELFIADFDPYYGIARDTSGSVAVFIPEQKTNYLIGELLVPASLCSAYENIGAIPGEFAGSKDIGAKTGINKNDIKHLVFPATFYFSHDHNTYSSALRFSNPLMDESGKMDTGKNYIRELFKHLNFNFESSNSYYAKNRIMIRDGQNTVYLYNDGKAVYTSGESADGSGKVHLSKFLGYDAAYYTYYEKIKAASIFVGKLSKELTGNESSLLLKSAATDADGNLLIIFSYYYEGIQIRVNGSDEGISLKIDKDSIAELTINTLDVSSQNMDMIKDKNFALELSIIDGIISRELEKEELQKEEIAKKYKLIYDKDLDKFILNALEPIYNINYAHIGGEGGLATAVREIIEK